MLGFICTWKLVLLTVKTYKCFDIICKYRLCFYKYKLYI